MRANESLISFSIDYLKSSMCCFLHVWRPQHIHISQNCTKCIAFYLHSTTNCNHNEITQAVCVYISFGETCRHCRTNGANNSSNTIFHCTECPYLQPIFSFIPIHFRYLRLFPLASCLSPSLSHTLTQSVIRPFVIIIFVCNSETRLLMYTLSFIHFPSKSNRTESTMVKYSFIQFSLVHSQLTHSFILYSSHALSVAFSFQLNHFKGLFGAFALLFSHQHALSPADESLWPLLFLHCFIVLLLFLRAMSTMECLMSYMRTDNTLLLLLLTFFRG